jgi:protein involved in polysaccharide export with SLBB domain
MKLPHRRVRQYIGMVCLAVAALAMTGCGTSRIEDPLPPSRTGQIPPLQIGESIQVELTGTPQIIPPLNLTISEKGTITLPLISKPITAVGLTARELEAIIQSNYVPNIYKEVNVTVTIGSRYYYISGEINQTANGKQLYTGHVTILGAISAAGGFNDFAATRRVKLTALDGTTYTENCVKARENAKFDMTVLPNDQIFVPKEGLPDIFGLRR